jgi:hypothetical protein
VALMSATLALQPGEKVLEIGTGSGYQALSSRRSRRTCSIEIKEPLAGSPRGPSGLGTRPSMFAGRQLLRLEGGAPFGDPRNRRRAASPAARGTAGRRLIPRPGRLRHAGPRLVTKDEKGKVRTRSLYDVRFVPLTGSLGVEKKGGAGGSEEGQRKRGPRRRAGKARAGNPIEGDRLRALRRGPPPRDLPPPRPLDRCTTRPR